MITFHRRLVTGLLPVLPFLVTFWIVYRLYSAPEDYVIGPIAAIVLRVVQGGTQDPHLPTWFAGYTAPALGLAAAVFVLYFLGFLTQPRFFRLLDYFLIRLPIVTIVHPVVSRTFESLRGGGQFGGLTRPALVAFPHPGMRLPRSVTSSCRDAETRKTILCVYVPTTPIPSSGYMLLIPEEEVTEPDRTRKRRHRLLFLWDHRANGRALPHSRPQTAMIKRLDFSRVSSRLEATNGQPRVWGKDLSRLAAKATTMTP